MNTLEDEHAFSVFHLGTVNQLPLTFVDKSVAVLEPAETFLFDVLKLDEVLILSMLCFRWRRSDLHFRWLILLRHCCFSTSPSFCYFFQAYYLMRSIACVYPSKWGERGNQPKHRGLSKLSQEEQLQERNSCKIYLRNQPSNLPQLVH